MAHPVPNRRLIRVGNARLRRGRLPTIHPFLDFNGRVTRLWLREILRRAHLPQVTLTTETENARTAYFRALEAADTRDWSPLGDIWKERFEQLPPPS